VDARQNLLAIGLLDENLLRDANLHASARPKGYSQAKDSLTEYRQARDLDHKRALDRKRDLDHENDLARKKDSAGKVDLASKTRPRADVLHCLFRTTGVRNRA
jgi:hypothetical protein